MARRVGVFESFDGLTEQGGVITFLSRHLNHNSHTKRYPVGLLLILEHGKNRSSIPPAITRSLAYKLSRMHCILLTLCVLIVGNKTATLTIPTGHSNIPPQHPLTNRSPFRCVTARTSKYSGTASGEREIQQGQEKERKHEDPSGHFVADSAISWVQQVLFF